MSYVGERFVDAARDRNRYELERLAQQDPYGLEDAVRYEGHRLSPGDRDFVERELRELCERSDVCIRPRW